MSVRAISKRISLLKLNANFSTVGRCHHLATLPAPSSQSITCYLWQKLWAKHTSSAGTDISAAAIRHGLQRSTILHYVHYKRHWQKLSSLHTRASKDKGCCILYFSHCQPIPWKYQSQQCLLTSTSCITKVWLNIELICIMQSKNNVARIKITRTLINTKFKRKDQWSDQSPDIEHRNCILTSSVVGYIRRFREEFPTRLECWCERYLQARNL